MAERTRYPSLDNAVGFMPKGRLEIPDRPDLQVFPSNIFITTPAMLPDRTPIFAVAMYLPDLATLEEKVTLKRLRYPNAIHPRYYLQLEHDSQEGSYTGTKFYEDRIIGMTVSDNFDELAVKIGQFGIGRYEGFQRLDGIPLRQVG